MEGGGNLAGNQDREDVSKLAALGVGASSRGIPCTMGGLFPVAEGIEGCPLVAPGGAGTG